MAKTKDVGSVELHSGLQGPVTSGDLCHVGKEEKSEDLHDCEFGRCGVFVLVGCTGRGSSSCSELVNGRYQFAIEKAPRVDDREATENLKALPKVKAQGSRCPSRVPKEFAGEVSTTDHVPVSLLPLNYAVTRHCC